ncbi:hypothetical protein GPALN_010196 [Globodera pallida]|nr:hypothetical protein GPALN_010196 [Globodera pallida]
MEQQQQQILVQNSTTTFQLHLLSSVCFSADQFLAVARNAWCTEYAPQRFHAIVMRVRQRDGGGGAGTDGSSTHVGSSTTPTSTTTTTTALIFRSGRVVLTGISCCSLTRIRACCMRQARRVCKRVRMALARGGHSGVAGTLAVRHLTLCNLVSTVRMPHRIDIEKMARHLSGFQRRAATTPQNTPIADAHAAEETPASHTHLIRRVRRLCLDLCTFPALRCTLELTRNGGTAASTLQPGGVAESAGVDGAHVCATPTLLFFVTGRVIVTGVRHPVELECATHATRCLCAQFRR